MKVQNVKYGRTYHLSDFESERIDVELQVFDNRVGEAFDIAKKYVETLHKRSLNNGGG
jgi:hypothetical protein